MSFINFQKIAAIDLKKMGGPYAVVKVTATFVVYGSDKIQAPTVLRKTLRNALVDNSIELSEFDVIGVAERSPAGVI